MKSSHCVVWQVQDLSSAIKTCAEKSETSDADKEFLSPSISRPAHHKIEGKLEPSLEALGET